MTRRVFGAQATALMTEDEVSGEIVIDFDDFRADMPETVVTPPEQLRDLVFATLPVLGRKPE